MTNCTCTSFKYSVHTYIQRLVTRHCCCTTAALHLPSDSRQEAAPSSPPSRSFPPSEPIAPSFPMSCLFCFNHRPHLLICLSQVLIFIIALSPPLLLLAPALSLASGPLCTNAGGAQRTFGAGFHRPSRTVLSSLFALCSLRLSLGLASCPPPFLPFLVPSLPPPSVSPLLLHLQRKRKGRNQLCRALVSFRFCVLSCPAPSCL